MNIKNIKYDKSINNEELIIKAKSGCEVSKELLFKNNIPLVKGIAEKWLRLGSTDDIDELMSMGLLGLTIAYNEFDPSRKLKFSTLLYKVVWMEFVKQVKHQKRKKRSKYDVVSIDNTIEDEDIASFHESVWDKEATNEYIEVEDAIYLSEVSGSRFNNKENNILKYRLIDDIPYDEIGQKLGGVSKQSIQQLHKKCINRILDEVRLIG